MKPSATHDWAFQHFDPRDQEKLQDPYPIYKEMRDKCPVAHSDAHEADGFWIVSRYEDVKAVCDDHQRFANGPSLSIPAMGSPIPLYPNEANPPRHAGLRRLASKALSPGTVATFEGRLRAYVVNLVDSLVARRSVDLVADLAFAVPATLLFHPPLLGYPLTQDGQDWLKTVQEWVFDLKYVPARSQGAGAKIRGYLDRIIADRRTKPQDDIPSVLIEAMDAGELTEAEALGTFFLLFFAGVDTSANAIGLQLLHMARHPEMRERFRRDPESIPLAIEELIRFYGPSQGVRRTVTEDLELHGRKMKAGDAVWIMFNAADRDERAFENADAIVYDRRPNRHVGFGSGIHRCIGSHLARLMLRVIMEEIVKAPPFRVEDETKLAWAMGTSRGLMTLPVVFDA